MHNLSNYWMKSSRWSEFIAVFIVSAERASWLALCCRWFQIEMIIASLLKMSQQKSAKYLNRDNVFCRNCLNSCMFRFSNRRSVKITIRKCIIMIYGLDLALLCFDMACLATVFRSPEPSKQQLSAFAWLLIIFVLLFASFMRILNLIEKKKRFSIIISCNLHIDDRLSLVGGIFCAEVVTISPTANQQLAGTRRIRFISSTVD